MSRRKPVASRLLFSVAASAALTAQVWAGGYSNINTTTGNALKWGNNNITLNCDLGDLSATVNNATAKTMVTNAIVHWNTANTPNCALNLSVGSDLGNNNANGNTTAPDYTAGCNSTNPVIYDATGLLTNSVIGDGANQSVLGFAGIYCINGGGDLALATTISKGRAVLNGLFIDGVAGNPNDKTQTEFEGVITHEIGHFLNLDHSQCGAAEAQDGAVNTDYDGFPTMYPLVHADCHDLEMDDKAWISNLYPSAAGLLKTSITGVTRTPAGALMNGVNVVARSATNHRDMISCVTGFSDPSVAINGSANEGLYKIPMLPKNTQWVLDVEPIDSGFKGGSGVGPVDPPLSLPYHTEFINESGQEDNNDSLTRSTTFLSPPDDGETTSGKDLTFNTTVNSPTIVSETDNGADTLPPAPTSVSVAPNVPLQVNGSMSAEIGFWSVSGDDIEDWYAVSAAGGAGVEITKITLSSADDMSLWVASYDQINDVLSLKGSSTSAGAGGTETVEGFFDPSNFGTGGSANLVFIGVSDTGTATGNYTLTVYATMADDDAVVVDKPFDVDPTDGLIVVTGRGFKNTGGAPTVTFSNPGITVNSVSFVNSTTLNVNVTREPSFVPFSSTDINVTNQAASGGYAGRAFEVDAVPVSVSNFTIE